MGALFLDFSKAFDTISHIAQQIENVWYQQSRIRMFCKPFII